MTTATTTLELSAARPSATLPLAGVVLATAITLSAFLLFQVQPLLGKYILPWFGGAAGVWTTCMIFFQLVLLGGYLYAHLSVTYLTPRWQGIVHGLLVLAAIASLPVIPADRWKPVDPTADPTGRILLLLLTTLGLPYFVLSATAPLLQGWFARLYPGRTPYRLYALSNAASLAALLTFPFVIEPLLARRSHAYAWSAAYVVLAGCLYACVALVWKAAPKPTLPDSTAAGQPVPSESAGGSPTARPPLIHYLLWLLLPACASVMFLAVTNKLSLDVAAVPFLWIVPLAIYLLSFIICFDSPRWYRRWFFGPLLVLGLAAASYMLVQGILWGTGANVLAYFLALSACCMVCHGELAALKPEPRRLTAFYLLIAAGGALGGIFVGIFAPLVFDAFIELQIGMGMTWLLFAVALAANPSSPLYAFRRPPAWYLLVVIGGLLIAALYGPVTVRNALTTDLARVRNFYGVIQVQDDIYRNEPFIMLKHNGIWHGMQLKDPARRMQLTSYYSAESGIGRLLASRSSRPIRLGAVGLGVGTLAAAGKPGDVIRFYELDPDVERVAREHFTFISGSQATVEVILGDARLSMEREAPQDYDVLALDAFSGDGIPFHLMTREVMETYLRHLKPDGVIAFHISNRHLDLAPVVEGLARHHGMHTIFIDEDNATWALASRESASLDAVRRFASPDLVPKRTLLWTDDYASLLPILMWRKP